MASGGPNQDRFPSPGSVPWKSSLCGCFTDCNSCCRAFCCPCIAFGEIAEILNQNTETRFSAAITCCCFGPLYTCGFRHQMRRWFGLPEEPCSDCCVDCCCLPCSLAQQYRELTGNGFAPSRGWAEHNLNAQVNLTTVTSAPEQPSMEGSRN